jgi:hypothetical protein
VLSFVMASTSILFWAIFLLQFFKHGRTMWADSVQSLLLLFPLVRFVVL